MKYPTSVRTHHSSTVPLLVFLRYDPKPSSSLNPFDEDDPSIPQTPKIFYTSRTHTQLRQLSSELQKTGFASARGRVRSDAGAGWKERLGDDSGVRLGVRKRVDIEIEVGEKAEAGEEDIELPVRTVPLGGRRQLCINEKVCSILLSSSSDFGSDGLSLFLSCFLAKTADNASSWRSSDRSGKLAN